jgi:hypothetical protein
MAVTALGRGRLGVPVQGIRSVRVCLPIQGRSVSVSVSGRKQFAGGEAPVSEALTAAKIERREQMLALLDRINANRERLRAKYGEFDVDADRYAMREDRERYLDGI